MSKKSLLSIAVAAGREWRRVVCVALLVVVSGILPVQAQRTEPPSAEVSTVPVEQARQVSPSAAGFSPQALFQRADAVGKSVILLLIFGSLLSWTLWVAKLWELAQRRYRLAQNLALLAQGRSVHDSLLSDASSPACADMLALARNELEAGAEGDGSPAVHVKERVQARILRVEAAEARILTRGASILATTSSIAPFIGLFGTVWGIMHSFISIAQTRSTNLSVVAPGIAEALFATALGLAVAIPAVIFYNTIARQISGYRQQLSDAATLILCLLSRDLDRREAALRPTGRTLIAAHGTTE